MRFCWVQAEFWSVASGPVKSYVVLGPDRAVLARFEVGDGQNARFLADAMAHAWANCYRGSRGGRATERMLRARR